MREAKRLSAFSFVFFMNGKEVAFKKKRIFVRIQVSQRE